jgi:hypothetical protein
VEPAQQPGQQQPQHQREKESDVSRAVQRKGGQTHESGRAVTRQSPLFSDEDIAFLSCWIGKDETGLPMAVYVGTKYADCPQIKVSQYYGDRPMIGEWFSMTISDQPRVIGDTGDIRVIDLALVEQFILVNKQFLLEYWEQTTALDVGDVLDRILGIEL